MKGLNVGCGPFRADLEGWVNTDVVHLPGDVEPDVVVTPDEPLPFDDGTFDRIYMGHVLEHVPWDKVVPFLQLVSSKLSDDGVVMVVGPDVNRSLRMWNDGTETLEHVLGVLEDDGHYQHHTADWFGARHCWNAYEGRVVRALEQAGFVDVKPLEIVRKADFEGWPVVSHSAYQCAVRAVKA
jgi:hypothetical protein